MKQSGRYFYKKRVYTFSAILLVMFSVLIRRFFTLQVLDGEKYRETFQSQVKREEVYPGSRGIIYDRNGKELAYNELTYTITIEDNGTYDNRRSRNETLNRIISETIGLIERNGDFILPYLSICINDSGEYEYTVEETILLRFLADVYGHGQVSELAYNARLGYDERTATAEQVMNYLYSDAMYGLQTGYSQEEAFQIASVRYAMGSNQYRRYIKTDLAENVSEKTMVAVLENQARLPGVDVSQTMVRRYSDSKYFAHILGYTGPVSEEELAQFEAQGIRYDRNDIVGKTGIEQSMEQELHGRNGGEQFYVDNVGRVTEVLNTVEASTGNNVYLSIDADLQKAIYDLLEQKLAGILLANITQEPSERSGDLSIPITDVYFALIDNHVIDTGQFSAPESGAAEQEVSRLFGAYLSQVMTGLQTAVRQPYQELEEGTQAYINYILEMMEQDGHYHREKADHNSELYWQWQDGGISLEEFLQGGIGEGWIDTAGLLRGGAYTVMEENLGALENWITARLREDTGFHTLLYRVMLQQGVVTGEQIGRILLEQGVVEDTGSDYEDLSNGSLSAYRFIREKIRNLEITPAELALDPSTASSVVVEPDTGKVLALVTYPGYDNNRLANSVDGAYYNRLLNDASLPLYNNATQQRTAPGSTFKPVTVSAGLSEHLIDSETEIEDMGLFELITPSPRCWIYAAGGTHGSIHVMEAIRDSCNYFFYTLGYQMSLEDNIYQENKGISTLRIYTEMFGFNENTGIEITESAPQMADGFPVMAAIGQSNHNYTTTQLARYTAALADKGNLHRLSLIDHIQTGSNGETVQTEEPEGRRLEEILPSAWDIIGEGMRMMAESNRVLKELPFSVAGKTGTAQQNRLRPNHALFIGYAPYEQPQIAVATRIAYGYSSSNAVEVTSYIFKYYFGVEDSEKLLTGQAEIPGNRGNSFTD